MTTSIDEQILEIVEKHEKGVTSKDINELLDGRNVKRGRNTVNATLHSLHGAGFIFAHTKRVNRCYLYFHSKYKNVFKPQERIDKPLPQTNWERAARLWREVAESETVTPDLYRRAIKAFNEAEHE